MGSLRLQRVRELLKREIGEVLRRELPVERAGLVTVNDVGVSGDLHSAKQSGFWWSHLGWILSDEYDTYDPKRISDFAK